MMRLEPPLRVDASLPQKHVVFLVDCDPERRHAIAQLLAGRCVVLPLESLAELSTRWPVEGIIMLADEADNLQSCTTAMDQDGICLPIVCFANKPTTSQMFAALFHQVCGFLALPASPADAFNEIKQASLRFGASRASRKAKSHAQLCMATLSAREREVLELFINGLCSKGSARALGLSPRTVELYRSKATLKLGARSLLHAAALVLAAQEVRQLESVNRCS